MTHTLDTLTAAGFKMTASYGLDYDLNETWTVTADKRAVKRHPNGRKKCGVGNNFFVGAGETIDGAIANMIENANEMAVALFGNQGGYQVEPNTDAKTAKEQPVIVTANDDPIARVKRLLLTHGNSALALSTLIHAGVVSPDEVRVATGLTPLAKAP